MARIDLERDRERRDPGDSTPDPHPGGEPGEVGSTHPRPGEDDRSAAPNGEACGAEGGLTGRLGRMYREVLEEPLPEPLRALVRRLRAANGNGAD